MVLPSSRSRAHARRAMPLVAFGLETQVSARSCALSPRQVRCSYSITSSARRRRIDHPSFRRSTVAATTKSRTPGPYFKILFYRQNVRMSLLRGKGAKRKVETRLPPSDGGSPSAVVAPKIATTVVNPGGQSLAHQPCHLRRGHAIRSRLQGEPGPNPQIQIVLSDQISVLPMKSALKRGTVVRLFLLAAVHGRRRTKVR